MSSIRKRGEKWQARVHRKDQKPVVQSFNAKADAIKWGHHVESQLDLETGLATLKCYGNRGQVKFFTVVSSMTTAHFIMGGYSTVDTDSRIALGERFIIRAMKRLKEAIHANDPDSIGFRRIHATAFLCSLIQLLINFWSLPKVSSWN